MELGPEPKLPKPGPEPAPALGGCSCKFEAFCDPAVGNALRCVAPIAAGELVIAEPPLFVVPPLWTLPKPLRQLYRQVCSHILPVGMSPPSVYGSGRRVWQPLGRG